MTPEARNLTKSLFEAILKNRGRYSMEDLQEYARDIVDEHGEVGEDFQSAVDEICSYEHEFFDSKGNLDRDMLEEFLTSYGY